ncbi:MAG: helix-turn-helix domain-containing protein [Candidatus Obscuribacterales bacterium]|nr:helix-turn-helix domain-containing protein [Candidatus Obscuribacterales bacterium]
MNHFDVLKRTSRYKQMETKKSTDKKKPPEQITTSEERAFQPTINSSAESGSDRFLSMERTLKELRRERQRSQGDLGLAMGVNQSEISKIEKRDDIYVSTLREYIEGLGGNLALIAMFKDMLPVLITQFDRSGKSTPNSEDLRNIDRILADRGARPSVANLWWRSIYGERKGETNPLVKANVVEENWYQKLLLEPATLSE